MTPMTNHLAFRRAQHERQRCAAWVDECVGDVRRVQAQLRDAVERQAVAEEQLAAADEAVRTAMGVAA